MARTVDPARHEQRRLQIIDAALTRFAADGYAGTSTAAICREAGIGSGTLFHYFPTKSAILVAILEYGTIESRARFASLAEVTDAAAALTTWVEQSAEDLADPRMAGFVNAVSAMVGIDEVAAALAEDEAVATRGLTELVARAQSAGQVRTDLPAPQLAAWLAVVVDGFTGRLATSPGFDAAAETPVLHDTIRRLLAPPETPPGSTWQAGGGPD